MSYVHPEGTKLISQAKPGIIKIKENLGPLDIRVLEITPGE
jgi:hypothetical protein